MTNINIYPNAERYGFKDFETKHCIAKCAGFDRGRNGYAHECYLTITDNDNQTYTATGLARWQGRTWESFKYESCIKDAIDELPEHLQQLATQELIKDTQEAERAESERFLNTFKSEYDKLPNSTKDVLSNVTLQTEQDAKCVLGIMTMINLLKEGD